MLAYASAAMLSWFDTQFFFVFSSSFILMRLPPFGKNRVEPGALEFITRPFAKRTARRSGFGLQKIERSPLILVAPISHPQPCKTIVRKLPQQTHWAIKVLSADDDRRRPTDAVRAGDRSSLELGLVLDVLITMATALPIQWRNLHLIVLYHS